MKDVSFETVGKVIVGLAGIGAALYGARKYSEDKKEMSFPDSYWEAKKEEEIQKTARHKIDIEAEAVENERRRAHELEVKKEQHEFEKSQPDTYWTYKTAESERRAREKIAEEDRKARTEQAAEMRRAIDGLRKGLTY